MKKHFSKEEIEKLNSLNLVELLRKDGYNIVAAHNGYYLEEHDSLKISEYNGWKWFSQDKGGKNIDFFMQYEDMDFITAANHIVQLSDATYEHTDAITKEKKYIEKDVNKIEYKKPTANIDNKRAFAYLTQKRCLDKSLVKSLMDTGYLYEDKEHHNVIFLATDYDGNVVSSFERGTTEKKFAGDTPGSIKDYRFRITSPGSDKVNIFEAEIDMLSYISMYGLENENYISLGGVSTRALDAFLNESGINVSTLNICLDNDKIGNQAAEKFKQKYSENYEIKRDLPKFKDYNEDLVNKTRDFEHSMNEDKEMVM